MEFLIYFLALIGIYFLVSFGWAIYEAIKYKYNMGFFEAMTWGPVLLLFIFFSC